MRLRRLGKDEEGFSLYLHPHGYVVVQRRRTWSERVGAMRGQACGIPLTWWEIYDHVARRREDAGTRFHLFAFHGHVQNEYRTLREARRWCDEHPRVGWADA